ncbi:MULTISPECIES: gas vesicle protein GvpG [Streptomycetaceae]|uniref:Gas vesicle protein n=1 Tax=Streptantibioticus cattleyicolor (strain ATCC 35852 / DSM 46488 / JCM 4925 / NBRC 14057 / NRRL 8057) TaxID=1003195 RepID=F8JX44_STREN|nr:MULTISPECIES: gas vesicle protein GvpG [Streptomycetaceae]AEW93321.1 hypothetical protein SCATT_09500 [Streptantibioticus cattleyicolor NRRL 8057 = DSM 46488]MYS58037.1 gas vesicle protein [Streptomyces sp. SID5468]CCB73679.1 Predicted protein [Streptantibioticus cattleyicolor NRRL 8057 = DSM 46488]
MGLLTAVLTLPAAPVRGTAWVLRQVVAEAERRYYDPEVIRAELAALAERLDAGELDADAFDAAEDALLERLAEAQRRRS